MSAEQHARAMARDRRAQQAATCPRCGSPSTDPDLTCPACEPDQWADVPAPERAPRVGGVLVQSDTFPGYYGWGLDEAAAVAEWKRQGGRGGSLRWVIDPFWSDARCDWNGSVIADVTDPASVAIPRRERPPVIVRGERVGPRGKRSPIDLDA